MTRSTFLLVAALVISAGASTETAQAQPAGYWYFSGRRGAYPMYYVPAGSGSQESGAAAAGGAGSVPQPKGASDQGAAAGKKTTCNDDQSGQALDLNSLLRELQLADLRQSLDNLHTKLGIEPEHRQEAALLPLLPSLLGGSGGNLTPSQVAELFRMFSPSRRGVGNTSTAGSSSTGAQTPATAVPTDPERDVARLTVQAYQAWKAEIDTRTTTDQAFAARIKELNAVSKDLQTQRAKTLEELTKQISELKGSLPEHQKGLVP